MNENGYDYNEYFNDADRKRLAKMLMLSRAESKLSQEKVAKERDEITHVRHVQPNLSVLEHAVQKGRHAVIKGTDNYLLVGETTKESL